MIKNNPIYQAQCFGNVEPIEYMVPYPNLRSLAIGQCIKFSNSVLFKDSGITNSLFLQSINKTANWLALQGISKNDKVFVKNIVSPRMEILSYAIWSVGATLIISDDKIDDTILRKIAPKLIIDKISEEDQSIIDGQSDQYIETSNTLLTDEAVIFFHNNNGIRLSHYNLLVNTYGVLKQLNILYNDVLNIEIPFNTSAGIVLKIILPLYAGASVSEKSANITFSANSDADYHIIFNWNELINTNPQSLYILPEATAVLAIGSTPNHVMAIAQKSNKYIINGHSVMMGYLDDKENRRVFKDDSLVI